MHRLTDRLFLRLRPFSLFVHCPLRSPLAYGLTDAIDPIRPLRSTFKHLLKACSTFEMDTLYHGGVGYCDDINVSLQILRVPHRVRASQPRFTFVLILVTSARVFLGLTEAGLFPGITFYLSLWYRRRDAAQRIAVFFSAATIAGAFGGLLAYAIEHMEGIGGLYGWQWIVSLCSADELSTQCTDSLSHLVLSGRHGYCSFR